MKEKQNFCVKLKNIVEKILKFNQDLLRCHNFFFQSRANTHLVNWNAVKKKIFTKILIRNKKIYLKNHFC